MTRRRIRELGISPGILPTGMENLPVKKILFALIFVLWMSAILTAFFVVQKPDFFQILPGLKNLFLILLVPCLMAVLAACAGSYLPPNSDPVERLALGTALGMGLWGLMGFALAALGWAKPTVIIVLFSALTGWFAVTGKLTLVWRDAKRTAGEISASMESSARWIHISAGIGLGLAVLMSLAPPIEDFDALLYHLTVPEWWLRDGGLLPHQAFIYWYPHLVEGSFVFPLALGVDTATHLTHLLWLALTMLIIWHWGRQVWGDAAAWDALAILLTMPSLFWLASWAYTDFALTFCGIAVLYAIWKWQNTADTRWVIVGGIAAGFAMGMKYTSFVVPLAGVALIALWGKTNSHKVKQIFFFSLAAALIGSPWYIRNWVWTGNPVYPFVFGGRFWDAFLAQKFSAAGTGIGFDPGALLLLPLTATLGTRDTNFFDGRFGPFFLILAPLVFLIRERESPARRMLQAIGVFSLGGIAFWTWGVMSSAHLFQARYLFPALLPLAIPLAAGLRALDKLDAPRFKVSFIVRAMLAVTVALNLFNFSLHVLVRNPLAAALQTISRHDYQMKILPDYTGALLLLQDIPADAKVYLLFEPRSYGMNVRVEPDIINANFAHDLALYQTPEKIVAAWREQGYTHVLLSRKGAKFIFQNSPSSTPDEEQALRKTEALLVYLSETKNGSYALYQIPR
jgi:hypothetical protein